MDISLLEVYAIFQIQTVKHFLVATVLLVRMVSSFPQAGVIH